MADQYYNNATSRFAGLGHRPRPAAWAV